MSRRTPLALVAAVVLIPPAAAQAWGAYGHRMIAVAAVRSLSADLPAFLSRPDTVWAVGELAREPDRSKGAGQPHDADLDPAHFINVDDDSRINGGPSLSALPRTRADYDAALRDKGGDSAKFGYLPYAIVDGWQQLVKDFGYWRIDRLGAEKATDPAQRDWFRKDLKLREMLIVRDLGYWSHYVGDAAQPLHVTIHYNAWGDYPNPNKYTAERIHGPFEGVFVHRNISQEEVLAALSPERVIRDPIMLETTLYIEQSRQQADPLFAAWTAGDFAGANPAKGKAFALARLGAGASELRDLIAAAWRASPDATVGYPAVKVSAIESGAAPLPYEAMIGAD